MNLYINCSPKLKKSATENIIGNLKNDSDKVIYLYKEDFINIDIVGVNSIIFCYPLYVDSPPSKLIEYMEYLDSNNIKLDNIKIYVICNCGFLEAEQNDISVEIMKNFCDNMGATYMGSLKIGSGSIIGQCSQNKLYKLISYDYLRKVKRLKKAINNLEPCELATRIHPIGKRLYALLANYSWKKQRKKNGICD